MSDCKMEMRFMGLWSAFATFNEAAGIFAAALARSFGLAPRQEIFTYDLPRDTAGLLDELKQAFGVTSDIDVLRRSLALAKLFVEMKRDDGTVSLLRADGTGELIIQLDG